MMNKDILEGKWKAMRAYIKVWWGKLTDDELDQRDDNSEQIVVMLQKKYGYTREDAVEILNKPFVRLQSRSEETGLNMSALPSHNFEEAE